MPGFGNLSIGENKGGAQIFAPSPLVGQYAQMLQQRQAKHDLEVKQLGDTLAKGYDPAGLRNDADKQAYVKQYADIKDAAIAAENEKNNTKKAIALAQVRQSLNDLSAFADGSKKQDKIEQDIAKEHALHPYTVDDDTAKRLTEQRSRVWNDPNNIKDWSQVIRGVDPEKQETQYQKTNDELLKHHPATYGTESIKYGQNVFGRKTAIGTSNRVIPYQDVLETQLHRATADLDYQKHLQNKYPNITDAHPQVQLAKRVAQDVADHGQQQGLFDKPKVKEYEDVAPLRHTLEAVQFYKNHGFWPETGQGQTGTNATAIIAENMRVSGDPNKFVPLIKNTIPKEQFAKGQDIQATTEVDPQTGQTVHIFKFPDKVKIDKKAVDANKAIEKAYNKSPQTEHWYGGKEIPFKQSDRYKKAVAKGQYVENPVTVEKDNSKPYRIPTGDPQAYGIGVADMLKEQGASEVEIQKILGKSGVNPVKLGQHPKEQKQPEIKIDPNVKYY